jgi:neuropeptide Y receptor
VCDWLQAVAVFLSAFTMLAISLDRYRAVIFPLRPRLTPRLAAAVIAVTWFLAMATSLPVAMFNRIAMHPDRLGVPRALCLEEWPGGTRSTSAPIQWPSWFCSTSCRWPFCHSPTSILVSSFGRRKRLARQRAARDQRLAASKRKVFLITGAAYQFFPSLSNHQVNKVFID